MASMAIRVTLRYNEVKPEISKEKEVLGKGRRKIVLSIMILSCYLML